jgi:DNA repair protein RecO (recombination protein O)
LDSDFARAYLLHRRPVSDSQAMLNVVVEGVGHIKMLARLKGKQQLKHSAQLQPFSPLLCRYAGRHDMKYLNQFELIQATQIMTGHRLYCGFYINELSYKLMPVNEPLEEAFELYQHHIGLLQSGEELEVVLRNYEFELLSLLGFGIEFEVDALGHPIISGQTYRYIAEHGFVPETGGYLGKVLTSIAKRDFSEASVRIHAKRLSREIFRPLLGYKELKSRELFVSR